MVIIILHRISAMKFTNPYWCTNSWLGWNSPLCFPMFHWWCREDLIRCTAECAEQCSTQTDPCRTRTAPQCCLRRCRCYSDIRTVRCPPYSSDWSLKRPIWRKWLRFDCCSWIRILTSTVLWALDNRKRQHPPRKRLKCWKLKEMIAPVLTWLTLCTRLYSCIDGL